VLAVAGAAVLGILLLLLLIPSSSPPSSQQQVVTGSGSSLPGSIGPKTDEPVGPGTAPPDLRTVLGKARISIVDVHTDHVVVRGIVVSADRGLVLTNFSALEGTETCYVTFPADNDERQYLVKGFLKAVPTKDLALVRIDVPSEKRLEPARLAERGPTQGDEVFTFDYSELSVDQALPGKVVSLHGGEEGSKGSFAGVLGFDAECTWIECAIPLAGENRGGPLLNRNGEVVGMNRIMVVPKDAKQKNLFALSADHLRRLIDGAGTHTKSLKLLPHFRRGDLRKTLAAWRALNHGLRQFLDRLPVAEERVRSAPAVDMSDRYRSLREHNEKLTASVRAYAHAYGELSAALRACDCQGVDPGILWFSRVIPQNLDRIAKFFDQMATGIVPLATDAQARAWAAIQRQKTVPAELQTLHEALRSALSDAYGRPFPTVAETAAEESDGATE
jgi:S1-C subfamily serine protease